MTPEERSQLIDAIALREGTAKEIAKWFEVSIDWLKSFVEENKEELEEVRNRANAQLASVEPTPTQLDHLWITNKFERLKRLQELAEIQYKDCQHGRLGGAELSTALREFRSYLALAANELGQLLHRGSGDSGVDEQLSVDIVGADMEKLR